MLICLIFSCYCSFLKMGYDDAFTLLFMRSKSACRYFYGGMYLLLEIMVVFLQWIKRTYILAHFFIHFPFYLVFHFIEWNCFLFLSICFWLSLKLLLISVNIITLLLLSCFSFFVAFLWIWISNNEAST